MTSEECSFCQKAIKTAYYEGFNDCLYKTSEYLKETCWLQSMALKGFLGVEDFPIQDDEDKK